MGIGKVLAQNVARHSALCLYVQWNESTKYSVTDILKYFPRTHKAKYPERLREHSEDKPQSLRERREKTR